jgi:hypothetical protein
MKAFRRKIVWEYLEMAGTGRVCMGYLKGTGSAEKVNESPVFDKEL